MVAVTAVHGCLLHQDHNTQVGDPSKCELPPYLKTSILYFLRKPQHEAHFTTAAIAGGKFF